MTSHSDLSALFTPRSVAVIGATDNPAKWGYQYCNRLLAAEHRRKVYLVNHNKAPVLGRATYGSIEDLPEAPEVAVLCVPRDAVLGAVESAARKGIKYVVCVTAGFAELSTEGRALQERIVAIAHASGMRVVGPNCLGLIDTAAEFQCTAFWDVAPGAIGIISQSGTVLLELGIRMASAKLGLSRGVSIGNQADLQLHEYMDSFVDETNTRIVVAYVEEFKDGRAFLEASRRVVASGKPVVLVSPHGSEAVARAVSSHTGSLVSSDAIVDAAMATAGIVRVSSTADLMLALKGLMSPARSRGRRVAVLADGGGCAALGTGLASQEGFSVPPFSEALKTSLKAVCTPESGISNPVDYVKALNFEVFVPVVETIARSGEVDAIVMTGFLNNVLPDPDPVKERGFGQKVLDAVAAHNVGFALSTVVPDEPPIHALAAAEVPVFDHVSDAVRCLRLGLVPPAANPPIILPERQERLGAHPGYHEARALLARAGITFPPARRVRTPQEALAAAREVGFPVVLKGLGSSHKSDSGAVILGLSGEAELAAELKRMAEKLNPPAFSVEAMIDGRAGVEVLIGAVRDRAFGPTIAVGLGGVLAEVLKDTAVALAPVDADAARLLLLSLKGAALFAGFRGKPAVDLAALAEIVSRFSHFVAAHPEIAEAEINPVIVLPGRAVAVDARIVVG